MHWVVKVLNPCGGNLLNNQTFLWNKSALIYPACSTSKVHDLTHYNSCSLYRSAITLTQHCATDLAFTCRDTVTWPLKCVLWSSFFRHAPWMLNHIWIWGILRPRQHLKLFVSVWAVFVLLQHELPVWGPAVTVVCSGHGRYAWCLG